MIKPNQKIAKSTSRQKQILINSLFHLQVVDLTNFSRIYLQRIRISHSVAGPLPVHHSSFHNPGLQYIAIQLTEVPPLGSPGAQKVKFAETLDDSQTKSPSLALSDPPSHL